MYHTMTNVYAAALRLKSPHQMMTLVSCMIFGP